MRVAMQARPEAADSSMTGWHALASERGQDGAAALFIHSSISLRKPRYSIEPSLTYTIDERLIALLLDEAGHVKARLRVLPAYGAGAVHKLLDALDGHDAADIDEADGIAFGHGRKGVLLKVHTGAGGAYPSYRAPYGDG